MISTSSNRKEVIANQYFIGEVRSINLIGNIGTILTTIGMEKQIHRASNNVERVEPIQKAFNQNKFKTQVTILESALKKDDDIAFLLRSRATEFLKDKDKSFRYLALALALATPGGKQIGQAYAQRAKLFQLLKEKHQCVVDVTSALRHDLPHGVRQHLFGVKERLCGQRTVEEMGPTDTMDSFRKKAYRDDVIFRVDNPGKKIPVALAGFEVKFNTIKGRYVVTRDALPPGKTLIVEDPYVSVMNNMMNFNMEYCAYCYRKADTLIPCTGCVFTMYCDKNCRAIHFDKGHRYECGCLPILHSLKGVTSLHLAFRSICKVGPTKLFQLFLNLKTEEALGNLPATGAKAGFSERTGIYHRDSYHPMRFLVFNEKGHNFPHLAYVSVILVQALKLRSTFFEDEPGMGASPFLNFIAAEIIQLTISIAVNNFRLVSWRSKYPTNVTPDSKYRHLPIGPDNHFRKEADYAVTVAVYPFISLLSHSCAPNAFCEYLDDGRMAIVATRDIRPGEEITISYGYLFWKQGLTYRKAALLEYYQFLCGCIACELEWASPLRGKDEPPIFLCHNCREELTPHQLARKKNKVVLCPTMKNRSKGRCPTCGLEAFLPDLNKEWAAYMESYRLAIQCIQFDKPMEAIPILVKCISYFQKNCAQPSQSYVNASIQLEIAHGLVYKNLKF